MVESKWEVTSTYRFDSQLNLVYSGMVVSTGAFSFKSCKQLCTAKTTFKTWFSDVPFKYHNVSNLADTALAATSNCPAPNTLSKYVRFSNVSTQSWFHVEKKKKKKKNSHTRIRTFTLTHVTNANTNEQWGSSTLSSTPPVHHCQGRCSHYGWNGCRIVNKHQQKNKQKTKKSLVLDKSLHSFTRAPSLPSFRYLVQQDYSAAEAAGASGLAAVSGSVGEASAGFSSPPSGAAAAATSSSCAFTTSSSDFGSSAAASLAPSSPASAGLASSAGAPSDAFSPSAGSSSATSSDSFLVFLKEKPLSLKEGFLKEKRFFFCLASSLVDAVPSSGLAEASPFVAAGSFSPLASAPSTFSPSSFGASSVGVLPLAWTSALLASSAAEEASPLVLAWPFSWGIIF